MAERESFIAPVQHVPSAVVFQSQNAQDSSNYFQTNLQEILLKRYQLEEIRGPPTIMQTIGMGLGLIIAALVQSLPIMAIWIGQLSIGQTLVMSQLGGMIGRISKGFKFQLRLKGLQAIGFRLIKLSSMSYILRCIPINYVQLLLYVSDVFFYFKGHYSLFFDKIGLTLYIANLIYMVFQTWKEWIALLLCVIAGLSIRHDEFSQGSIARLPGIIIGFFLTNFSFKLQKIISLAIFISHSVLQQLVQNLTSRFVEQNLRIKAKRQEWIYGSLAVGQWNSLVGGVGLLLIA